MKILRKILPFIQALIGLPKRSKSRRVSHRESILIEIDQDIVKRPEFKAYGVKDE